MGLQAVAVLSAGQDPSKIQLDGFQNLVVAFDSDKAGRDATRRWITHFEGKQNIKAILPGQGVDWNDILMDFRGENVKNRFEKRLPEYSFNAELALSGSAQEYLDRFIEFKKYSPQLFEFNGVYYFAKPQHRGERFFAVQVSDFTVEPNFFLLDDTIKDRQVYRYGLTISPKGRKKIQAIFEPKELSTTKELVTAFLARARCTWSGDGTATNLFCSMITNSGAYELRQLQSVGYDEITDCYVFQKFMIDPSGKMILPDKGLYSLPGNLYVRPMQSKNIQPVPGISARDLWSMLIAAWGDRAAVAVAWMTASWFVHRVREKTGFFPFLSLYHDPQTGKSALMRYLNRMQGTDEEGLTMTKADTLKGLTRKLGQKSALFTGLSEINKNENTKMPIDSVLAWYDGSVLSTRAAFTGGNEVVEIPFKGAVMFCQNNEPFLTQPQKERVVSIRFEHEMLSRDTMAAFLTLAGIPINQLSNFFVEVMEHREFIEKKWFESFVAAKEELFKAANVSNRLVDTHGLVLAFHNVLCKAIGVDYDLKPYIIEIMKEKHLSSQDNEFTVADSFFAEIASILRDCQSLNKRWFTGFIDFDAACNKLWVHVHDLVRSTQSTILNKYPIEKLNNSLKDHPAYVLRNHPHRFKEWRPDINEYMSRTKKGWCFDLNKIGDAFDFDIRSMSW
jgi:hypothetical protein